MEFQLRKLGIYEDAINSAIETAEHAVRHAGLGKSGINDLHEMALEELKESGSFDDITNSIIDAYFIVAKDMIRQSFPKLECDFYVNCEDSDFYINGEAM